MLIFSHLALGTIIALCIWGGLSRRYDDNIMQTVGLMLVAIWCGGELNSLTAYRPNTPLHVALLLFAVGTAWRHSRRRTDRRRGQAPTKARSRRFDDVKSG